MGQEKKSILGTEKVERWQIFPLAGEYSGLCVLFRHIQQLAKGKECGKLVSDEEHFANQIGDISNINFSHLLLNKKGYPFVFLILNKVKQSNLILFSFHVLPQHHYSHFMY
jgi:hypothetical protein